MRFGSFDGGECNLSSFANGTESRDSLAGSAGGESLRGGKLAKHSIEPSWVSSLAFF